VAALLGGIALVGQTVAKGKDRVTGNGGMTHAVSRVGDDNRRASMPALERDFA
jgi:hypothetical protein